jgi:5-methylcytosine-specific restriction enzyme B
MGKIVSKTVSGVYAPLIKDCKNLILRGAPGTGKTYLAKQLAAYLVEGSEWNPSSPLQKERICFVQFHPSYDYTDFVEGLRPAENGTFVRQDGIFKEFCKKAFGEIEKSVATNAANMTFKSALDELINDFKSGKISMIPYDNNEGGYKIKDITDSKIQVVSSLNDKQYYIYIQELMEIGPNYPYLRGKDLIKWSKDYKITGKNRYPFMTTLIYIYDTYMPNISNEDKTEQIPPFVFIIDEINRGEISRIFGELFFSIDPDYRGEAGRVKTQYNNMVPKGDVFEDGFFVPENVYIIGTMNDIDRGVECIDFAMHRRFLFKEVTIKDSIREMSITGDAQKKMKALNKAITDIGKLSDEYHIGGSYFRNAKTDADFQTLWDNRLATLIKEYLRGNPRMDEQYKEIEKAFKDQKSN